LTTGKQATYTLSSGLRIATFGGKFDLDQFTQAEMDNVKVSFARLRMDLF
jgi:hypothetical protein